MRIVGNSPVWVKALAAPIALLLCFAVIGVNAFLTLDRSERELTALSHVDLPKQNAISDLTYNIMTSHAQAARYVTWATNGVQPELRDELGREVLSGLDMWKEKLTSVQKGADLSPIEQSTLSELITKWSQYHAAVEDAIEVGTSHAAQASVLLAVADAEFKNVAFQLLILSAVASHHTRLVSHEIAVAARANKQLLAVGGLVGLLVSALLTLCVARSIVTPISAVTRGMQQVSTGGIEGLIGLRDRKDEIGQMVKAIGVFRQNIEQQNDVLKAREAQLEAHNLRFNAALGHMSQGLSMFDGQQRLIICNERYAEMYGLTPELVEPGTTFRQIIEHRINNGIHYAGTTPEDYVRERTAPVTEASDKIFELNDGRLISVARRPMTGGGWVTTHEDITERRRIEMRVAHMAHHDALTDLPNRLLLRERLDQALANEGHGLAVLMLDLDRFKEINDTLGHPAGDILLKTVAERLLSCVRETDTVARLGGDEFAIVQSVIDAGPETAVLAKRILDLMSTSFDLNGHHATIGTSIGIAVAPGDGSTPDELLKNADLALYR
jgi:diguanylate cyclase (GGDEF)-like protein